MESIEVLPRCMLGHIITVITLAAQAVERNVMTHRVVSTRAKGPTAFNREAGGGRGNTSVLQQAVVIGT